MSVRTTPNPLDREAYLDPDRELMLLRAYRHQWGSGKTHAYDPDADRTRCGKSHAECPGATGSGRLRAVDCKVCARAFEADVTRAEQHAESQQRQAEQDAWWEERRRWYREDYLSLIRMEGPCSARPRPRQRDLRGVPPPAGDRDPPPHLQAHRRQTAIRARRDLPAMPCAAVRRARLTGRLVGGRGMTDPRSRPAALRGEPVDPSSRFTWHRVIGWERKGRPADPTLRCASGAMGGRTTAASAREIEGQPGTGSVQL